MLDWIRSLPGPVNVVCEAGPTGFGLARDLNAAGFPTVVAAPSKLQRPSGDRVKTDARDDLHLARLLKLGEITGVRIPSFDQEAARDLVRAGTGSPNSCCARASFIPMGGLGPGCTKIWLNRQHFSEPARELTYQSCLAFGLAVEIGDWDRFTGSSIGAYLGLVPS